MSKLDLYKCDICQSRHDSTRVHGLKWATNSTLETRLPCDCPIHVCTGCWSALARVFDSLPRQVGDGKKNNSANS